MPLLSLTSSYPSLLQCREGPSLNATLERRGRGILQAGTPLSSLSPHCVHRNGAKSQAKNARALGSPGVLIKPPRTCEGGERGLDTPIKPTKALGGAEALLGLTVPPFSLMGLERDLDSGTEPRKTLKSSIIFGLSLSRFSAIKVSSTKVESGTTGGQFICSRPYS